jgi:prepilin-type N-terminal cleavage/methylation domain-containing protein
MRVTRPRGSGLSVMSCNRRRESGLTLTELLVVIAIIAVLSALLMPAISKAKDKARLTVCLNNLRQVNVAVRLYADDFNDGLPNSGAGAAATNRGILYSGYKRLIDEYMGTRSGSSRTHQIFSCPADVFYPSFMRSGGGAARNIQESLHKTDAFDYSSYAFNGGDNMIRSNRTDRWRDLGLTGHTMSSVRDPSRTVLVCEAAAIVPWSWHEPARGKLQYGDARDVVTFVDGHASVVKIFWDGSRLSSGAFTFAFNADPPANYQYQWSPN